MMYINKLSGFLLLLAGLQGCITVDPVRPEPLYSPTYPVVPPAQPASAGSIFQGARSVALYEDSRANQIGDVVTIFFEERTRSSKSAETEIRKESTTELPNPTVFGKVIDGNSDTDLNSIDNSTDFSGEAGSDQQNSLSGTLTAVVADVLPNGLLLVQGEKWLNLNRGEEYLRVSGLLRPEDIDGNNSVSSLRLADARIAYSGTGELAAANSAGWLTRFFLDPVYPF